MIGHGFQDTFDVVELHLLERTLERAAWWQCERAVIVRLFRDFGRSHRARRAAAWSWRCALVYRMSGEFALNAFGVICAADLPAPFGWRWEREEGVHAYWLMPWWVYYPRQLWLRRWRALIPLIRIGVLQGKEGCYLWEVRPTWRVYHSPWVYRRHPRVTAWCLRMRDRWLRTMPVWP
jgi:hypothetical protein